MNTYFIVALCAVCFCGAIYFFIRPNDKSVARRTEQNADDVLKAEEAPIHDKKPDQSGQLDKIDSGSLSAQQIEPAKLFKCTVFAPPSAKAGTAIMIQMFAHLATHQQIVRALAVEADDTSKPRGSRQLDSVIEHGTRLTFHFSMPGVDIEEPTQHLFWTGLPESIQFSVAIGADQRWCNNRHHLRL